MRKNKWIGITNPTLEIKTKQNIFFNKNKILLRPQGHDVQIGSSPIGWGGGGGGGPYLTLTGRLLLWLNFLSCRQIILLQLYFPDSWWREGSMMPPHRWSIKCKVDSPDIVFWESATILQLFAHKSQMQLVRQDVPWISPLTFSVVSLGWSSWVMAFCQGLLQRSASLCLLGG